MSTEKQPVLDGARPLQPPQEHAPYLTNGSRNLLYSVAIAFLTPLTAEYLGLSFNVQTVALVLTYSIAAMAVSRCGDGRTDSYIVNLSLGFLAQTSCHHFDLSPTMRVINFAITGFTFYLASRKEETGASAEPPASGPRSESRNASKDIINGSNIFPVCATMVLVITVVLGYIAGHTGARNCSAIPVQLDENHWTVLVPSGGSGDDCDTATQLRLIENAITSYTKHIQDDACRVICIKSNFRGQYAGYVSMSPPGSAVDGYYCGEAHSFGDCGNGVVPQRVGSV